MRASQLPPAPFAHGRAAELAPHQVGLVASDVIDSLPLALTVSAPLGDHDRPRCAATQRTHSVARTRRRRSSGRSSRPTVTGTVRSTSPAPRSVREQRRSASRPSRKVSRCATSSARERILVHGARRLEPRGRSRSRRQARARDRRRRDPGGRSRPSEARHRYGPLRALRVAVTAGGSRRADDPPRDRRQRSRRSPRAARAVQRRNRAVQPAHTPRGQQRRRPANPGVAFRRGTLRGRDVRTVAVQHRSAGGRARARAVVAEPRSHR